MSLRLILAASAALAFAAPALAQDAPAGPPAAEAKSAAKIAFEARREAFQARMEQMQGELEAAVAGAGADQTRGMADVDAILARYQPEIDGFVAEFEAFLDAESAASPDKLPPAEAESAKAGVRAALAALPAQIRTGAQSALAAQATAAAA